MKTMEAREKDLSHIKAYIEDVDKEVMMILQSLQWDRKHLLESAPLATCRYNSSHKVPLAIMGSHETTCLLKNCGYTQEDRLLPDPPDDKAATLVKLSKEDINQIIENAAICDPSFKRGPGIEDVQPLTVERLQSSYTTDERRAIHDAVVSTAPTIQQLSDLTVPGNDEMPTRERSRVEVLAELRDMKRRRTKYRTTARTSKYSDVLRDLIKTQMDLYCETIGMDQSNDNDHDTTHNDEDINTTLTKPHSSYYKEMSKNAYTDNRCPRSYKATFSERPQHKQDRRREHNNSRYRNDSSENRNRRDDIKNKHHHKQDRQHRHTKSQSYEYEFDRDIKKEPEELSTGHSSKSYEDRSRELSTDKYRNDYKYEDRPRLHNNEEYFGRKDYDSERSERTSRPTNRCKDHHRGSDYYKYYERKRKHNNDRPKEDFYIRYKDIKREKSAECETDNSIKRKKY